MGLFDGLLGDFAGDFIGNFVDEFGMGGLSGQFLPQPVSQPFYGGGVQAIPVAAPAGQVATMAARALAAGLPAWSARFPALWQAVQKLRAQGSKVSLEQLKNMLRKWGPTALTGVIGAQAVADLVTYQMTHKRRRMNPANTKALRRSLRRLRSFDRLSSRVHVQLSRSCRAPRRTLKKCA